MSVSILLISRFIPACAGNSFLIPSLSGTNTVHPRLRGELRMSAGKPSKNSGSSPLARGTHRLEFFLVASRRFIPACAGNSPLIRSKTTLSPVHPRLRGELAEVVSDPQNADGSSPLARGTLLALSYPVISHSVHPRLRGELT